MTDSKPLEPDNGTWLELTIPLIARFEVAAKFNASAVHDGEGADALAKLMRAMAEHLDFAVANYVPTSALAERDAEIERLREDCRKLSELAAYEIVAHCEGCGAWLLDDDDFMSGGDVSGCWAAMTDLPSKRERPCYAYRVGKADARAALADDREKLG